MIYEWRYTLTGKVKHSVNVEHKNAAAQCGTGPMWFDSWYGTGSQDEYDKVKSLPPCKKCVEKGPLPPEESK